MIHRLICIGCLLATILCTSWGFYAHKLINNNAVFTLPTELALFYKQHIKVITETAVDADKRCYVDSAESPRHYIDIDDFEDDIDSIPIHWSKAVEKYQERQLLARGIVPWQIYRSYRNLVHAFSEKNIRQIIRHSADLGHYIGDAHVPLHTTSNYNGQYTQQIGIHAFWESRLPEMFAKEYNLLVGRAHYIDDPLETAWNIVHQSHALVDSVLSIEKALSERIPQNQQKSYIERNNILTFNYSDHYATQYHEALNGMVYRRMKASISMVGCYWFSAWVDAGQPDLGKLAIHRDTQLDTIPSGNGKIIGREEWH